MIAPLFVLPGLLASLLPWHAARQSALDLEILDRPPRYVAWADLYRDLPRRALTLRGEFGSDPVPVEAALLADVQRGLNENRADVVIARCSDGYLSVFSRTFIARYRPVLVLTLNGLPPAQWPPPGMKNNPGPFLITVAEELAPGVGRLPDISHKEPWSVVSLEFGREEALFAALAPAEPAARRLWINSCASCHAGPPGVPGGARSGVAFATLQADARQRPDFVRRYVQAPRSVNPAARMEPQPDDTGPALGALIEFLGRPPR